MAGRPETYTIKQVVKDETWTGNDNTEMRTLEVILSGETGSRKATKPVASFPAFPGGAPQQGGKITGWLNEGGKFGLASDQNAGGNGSGPSAAPQASSAGVQDEFARRPDHPTVEARAKHTASMSATPAYIEQMLTINAIEQPKDAKEYWALVELTIGKLKSLYPEPPQPEQQLPGLEVAPEEMASPDPTPASPNPPF